MEPLMTGTLHNSSRTPDNGVIQYPVHYDYPAFQFGVVSQDTHHRYCWWEEVIEKMKRGIMEL